MLCSSAQASMAFDVNSVPLSETFIPGLAAVFDRRGQLARAGPMPSRQAVVSQFEIW